MPLPFLDGFVPLPPIRGRPSLPAVTPPTMAAWALRILDKRDGRAGFFFRESGDTGGCCAMLVVLCVDLDAR